MLGLWLSRSQVFVERVRSVLCAFPRGFWCVCVGGEEQSEVSSSSAEDMVWGFAGLVKESEGVDQMDTFGRLIDVPMAFGNTGTMVGSAGDSVESFCLLVVRGPSPSSSYTGSTFLGFVLDFAEG